MLVSELMITPLQRRQHFPELERLISRAVTNERFAAQLVSAPATALAQSEYGERLSATEHAMVVSITGAGDLHQFAAQLHEKVQLARSTRYGS